MPAVEEWRLEQLLAPGDSRVEKLCIDECTKDHLSCIPIYLFALLESTVRWRADLLGNLPARGLRVVLLHHLLLQSALHKITQRLS